MDDRVLENYLGWEVTLDGKGTFYARNAGHTINSPSLSALKRKIGKMVAATTPTDALQLWQLDRSDDNAQAYEVVTVTGIRVRRGYPEVIVRHGNGVQDTIGRWNWGRRYYLPNQDLLPLLQQQRSLQGRINALHEELFVLDDRINEFAITHESLVEMLSQNQNPGQPAQPGNVTDWREDEE